MALSLDMTEGRPPRHFHLGHVAATTRSRLCKVYGIIKAFLLETKGEYTISCRLSATVEVKFNLVEGGGYLEVLCSPDLDINFHTIYFTLKGFR